MSPAKSDWPLPLLVLTIVCMVNNELWRSFISWGTALLVTLTTLPFLGLAVWMSSPDLLLQVGQRLDIFVSYAP